MITIANKLYKTQIDCSTYEPQIDSTNTIITVTIYDFNNQVVNGATVNISVDKGVLTKKQNNTTSSNLSNVKTASMTTGSNGVVQFTYKANEWGFANISVNNSNIKLFVSGWQEHLMDEVEFYPWGSDVDEEDNQDLVNNPRYYIDESINHIIFVGQMPKHKFSANVTEQIGEFNPSKQGATLPTVITNEQTINTTQNSNKTYSIGIDNAWGQSWNLEWDMKTSMTSAIICVGWASSVNIGTSTFDNYIGLGVWSDGKVTAVNKYANVSADRTSGGNWTLNTWHHCQIECNNGYYYFTCDNVQIDNFGGGPLQNNYSYSIYLAAWKTGTVNIKNISFEKTSSPYLPPSNVKTIIYRPDVQISLDSHGILTARSEINAHPSVAEFRLDWTFIHPDMNYIPPSNYIN